MLKADFRLKKLKFEEKRFRRELEDAVLELVTNAAREWLRAVIARVPVQTGHAQGSLLPLARAVNYNLTIAPKRYVKGKNPARGARESRRKNFVFPSKNQAGAFSYSFKWHTDVEHFIILDENAHPRVASAPWHAVEAGNVAFEM